MKKSILLYIAVGAGAVSCAAFIIFALMHCKDIYETIRNQANKINVLAKNGELLAKKILQKNK